MSDIRATTLTVAGLNLLAECMTGKELHFTRVCLGDGTIQDHSPEAIKDMTAMVHEVMDLPIMSKRVVGDGTMVMNTKLNNSQLTVGFIASCVIILVVGAITFIKSKRK